MRILTLDLATTTGFAFGEAGAVPESGSVILSKKGDDAHQPSRALGTWLRKRFFTFKDSYPTLIVAEDLMSPDAQPHQSVIISQILLHGSLNCLAANYGVEVRRVAASTVRKHFCGKAFALPRGKGPRTPKERAEARAATKAMVLRQCHLLNYFPRSVDDDNRADAVAVFDYSSAHYARMPVTQAFALSAGGGQ